MCSVPLAILNEKHSVGIIICSCISMSNSPAVLLVNKKKLQTAFCLLFGLSTYASMHVCMCVCHYVSIFIYTFVFSFQYLASAS